jgi:prepilin-type N-terminal cleavage/methylation domain-containing protein
MHRTSRSNRRGFTLIEMLIVVGIIGILLGLTLTVLGYALRRKNETATRVLIGDLTKALENYRFQEKLKKEIEVVTKQTKKQITVYGFVDFLPELIAKADVVIAKAGEGVVHEVLQQKKPLIISHFIWGQETGNKDFVVNNGLGFYEPKAKNIPALVQRCLYDAEIRQSLEKAYSEHLQRNGVGEVEQYLASLTKGA